MLTEYKILLILFIDLLHTHLSTHISFLYILIIWVFFLNNVKSTSDRIIQYKNLYSTENLYMCSPSSHPPLHFPAPPNLK